MSTKITIAGLSESTPEGVVGSWLKKVGDDVIAGETIVEIETDKVVLEIPAPVSGVLEDISKSANDTVVNNDVIGMIAESDNVIAITPEKSADNSNDNESVAVNQLEDPVTEIIEVAPPQLHSATSRKTSPAVRKLIAENALDINQIQATGKSGRITKQDVLNNLNQPFKTASSDLIVSPSERVDESVPMSSLRKRVAQRLVSAQKEYAMLTTFNEVNMQRVLDIRAKYKDQFSELHGVKLGFMSFFSLAVVEALKKYPILNASVENENIIYHHYVDLGIAVSSDRGLVVPIIRDAHEKSLSQLELEIHDLAGKSRENKLVIEDLTGGTFTITNGGVFGSMMSTPIINPPQSAILGMHTITKKPVVENDDIVVRPMMYLALSYDHRIIDGKEAVLFLSTIKEIIEDPVKLLLHV